MQGDLKFILENMKLNAANIPFEFYKMAKRTLFRKWAVSISQNL